MLDLVKSFSFREKSLWVETAIYVYLWVWYFRRVGAGLVDTSMGREETFGLLITMTIIVVILSIFSQIVLAIISPGESDAPADERDKLMAWRAGSHASYMLGAGVFMVAIHSLVNEVPTAGVVHRLILMLVAVEILTNALQIYYYRRGY
ncbi:MAG TPA: hypothetical protein VJ984_07040 [Xanthomonadales bacterium]|nr:hypothetical protein [Xanthomonadales bacterium]